MPERQLTQEFSICLIPTDDIIDEVESLRHELPKSPYRDDIPHITLLRGISSSREMSDQALLEDIDSLLAISDKLPLQSTVTGIANKSGKFYSTTSGLILHPSDELLSYRANVADKLSENDYTIEAEELLEYMPHITIRLGVPIEGDKYKRAQELFEAKVISFNHWVLFRLVLVDGKRTMHEVRPSFA